MRTFKLKAYALELGLDEILLRPAEWKAAQQVLQQHIQERTAVRAESTSTRSSSTTVDQLLVQAQDQLTLEQGKSKQLARILIGKMSPQVSQLLQESLPENDQFDPIEITLSVSSPAVCCI